jgi:hypothetical protein
MLTSRCGKSKTPSGIAYTLDHRLQVQWRRRRNPNRNKQRRFDFGDTLNSCESLRNLRCSALKRPDSMRLGTSERAAVYVWCAQRQRNEPL